MTYQDWLATVPKEITEDVLWRMEVYRVSLFAGDLAWCDATKLAQDRRTLRLSDQLYAAVGSVSANISEGYSRSSHKDQARFYEYSPGSAREARNWHFGGRHLLGDPVANHRLQLLTQIIRQLLKIIPAERGYRLEEESPAYSITPQGMALADLLMNVPMPESPLDAPRTTHHEAAHA